MARSTDMRRAALTVRLLAAVAASGLVFAVRASAASDLGSDAQRAAGKEVYTRNCVQCHGEKGDGNGVAAPHLQPRPRDFTSGKFKIRTTPSGEAPDRRRPEAHHQGRHALQLDAGVAAALRYRPREPRLLREIVLARLREARQPGRGRSRSRQPPALTKESVERGKQSYADLGCKRLPRRARPHRRHDGADA